MRKYLMIAVGGFLGAVLRYEVAQLALSAGLQYSFLGTFLTNFSGSFFLGIGSILFIQHFKWQEDHVKGITIGFLGGFTTFSTFCGETIVLLKQGEVFPAAAYLLITPVMGLLAVYTGVVSARAILQINWLERQQDRKYIQRKAENEE